MHHFSRTAVILLALIAPLSLAEGAHAHESSTARAQAVITSTRVAIPNGSLAGPLYVTIGGKERKIADEAVAAWIIRKGRSVVYSGLDGAGGFENEGQSLRIYDARTGRRRKILSEHVAVVKITEVTTSKNKTALLVDMVDGGLGASYLAVVDPDRGEVFYRRWVRIISRRGDVLVIGHYKEDDWEELNTNRNATIAPYKKERLNLSTILKRRVIVNKRDR